MNKNKVLNVIFAGVGGQGNILVSHLLANAVLSQGLEVKLTETFGAATRGGSVFSCLRIGEAGAPLPKSHSVELLVALEPVEGLRQAIKYLAPGGWVIMNTHPWYPVDVNTGQIAYPETSEIENAYKNLEAKLIKFNATDIALEVGNSKTMNIVLLGAVMALDIVPVEQEIVVDQISQQWKKNIAEMNLVAYKKGYDLVKSIINNIDPSHS